MRCNLLDRVPAVGTVLPMSNTSGLDLAPLFEAAVEVDVALAGGVSEWLYSVLVPAVLREALGEDRQDVAEVLLDRGQRTPSENLRMAHGLSAVTGWGAPPFRRGYKGWVTTVLWKACRAVYWQEDGESRLCAAYAAEAVQEASKKLDVDGMVMDLVTERLLG